MDLELASVARACIDLADGKASPELASRCAIKFCRKLGKRRVVGPWRSFCQRPAHQILKEKSAHIAVLEVVARVGAVEGPIAEREVGDDVAFDRNL
jgi:hypothetical protein